MRILHLDDQGGWHGGEQQVGYLVNQLPDYGHEAFVAGKPESPLMQADFGGAESARFELPFRGELDVVTAWRIAGICKKHGIDLLHAHTSHTHTTALLARAIRPRVRVVVSRRVDLIPHPGRLNRWKYLSPDALIAISKRIAEVMRQYGVPSEKISTVHSGIDSARLNVDPLPRSELPIGRDGPLLCNVAALVPPKDQETLIRAMPAVLRVHPAAELVIVGEGKLRNAIETLIAELRLADSVHLLGYRKDVPRILRASDLFVLSSKAEGLGTSVLDAMAVRVPVVATDAGGIPEMVRDCETGWLAPRESPAELADRITAALNEPDRAKTYAENAYRMVMSEFSAAAMVRGNVAVYEALFLGPER